MHLLVLAAIANCSMRGCGLFKKRVLYVNVKQFRRYDYSHLGWKIRCDRKPETQLWHSVHYVCMAYTR